MEKLTIFERVPVNPVAYDCPPNDVVTHRIVSKFPQLVPKGLKISQLPHDVLSKIKVEIISPEVVFIVTVIFAAGFFKEDDFFAQVYNDLSVTNSLPK